MNSLKRLLFRPNFVRYLQSNNPRIKDFPKGVNEVRLAGTVTEVLPKNESLLLFMRTYDHKHFYEVHVVSVPNFKTANIPPLSVGQKIFVTGKLRLTTFNKENGKKGQSIGVSARQVYRCETDDEIIPPSDDIETNQMKEYETNMAVNRPSNILTDDKNHVELLDQICFEITHEEKFTAFSIASHFNARNAAGEDVEKVDFIPIFVYDDQLREYVRDHLKRLDRVRIEGEMKQKWAIDEFGKRKSSGYIKANRINKMVSLHKVSRSALPEDQRSFLDVSP